mmetsp:Transcript_29089/g.84531  ORF Transcript_29089/g.84531 Transcript_29089/m.84531 type:complete len:335 (-) Transcript_29089:279-1283(-)
MIDYMHPIIPSVMCITSHHLSHIHSSPPHSIQPSTKPNRRRSECPSRPSTASPSTASTPTTSRSSRMPATTPSSRSLTPPSASCPTSRASRRPRSSRSRRSFGPWSRPTSRRPPMPSRIARPCSPSPPGPSSSTSSSRVASRRGPSPRCLVNSAALPHPLRHVPAGRHRRRCRGQGHVHRHRGDLPPRTAPGHRRAVQHGPRRHPRERRVRPRPQQRASDGAPQGGGRHPQPGSLRPHRGGFGHGPVPDRLFGPGRAVRAADADGPVPPAADPSRRGIRRRRPHYQPGRGQPRRHVVRQGLDQAHRRQHHRPCLHHPSAHAQGPGGESHLHRVR